MEIAHSKLYTNLHEYTIDKIYDIIEKYGSQLDNKQLEIFNNLIASNRVIVVHAFDDKVKEHFKGETIPNASGPRSWEDGLIHLYPFFYNNYESDEVSQKFIDGGVITHELFHYIITLDSLNNNPERNKYFSYLNEGFVQYLTEQTEGKVFSSCNFRRNVEFVKKILDRINNNLKGILNKKLNEEEMNTINEMYNDYILEQEFMIDFNEYLKTVSDKVKIPYEKMIHYYQTKSVESIIDDMYNQLLKTDDSELKRGFDNLVEKYDELQKKKINK